MKSPETALIGRGHPAHGCLRAGFLATISACLQVLCWTSCALVAGKTDFSSGGRGLPVPSAAWPSFAAVLEDHWCIGLWGVALAVALFAAVWTALGFDPDAEGHLPSTRRIAFTLFFLLVDIACLASAWALLGTLSRARS